MDVLDKNIFIEFIKKDNDKRLVTGYASTPALDSQGEIVEKDAIANALAGYLGNWDEKNKRWIYGGIREMHQMSAVGKTIKAQVDNKGLYIEGKVVDDNAWKKVKEGVYAGFSIGGKVIKQIGNRIKDLKLSEISLVDRPANPDAVFMMVKADSSGKMKDIQKEEMQMPQPPVEYTASMILELAKDIRYLITMFESSGKSIVELSKALDLLKKVATKVLSEDDKKKFETILYGIDFKELENMTKAKLPFRNRKKMPTSSFAYVDSKGGKHLPIMDASHTRNAMARWNQTHFESPEKKRSAARKILAAARRFGIEIDPNSSIAQAAKKAETSDIGKYIDTNWVPGYFGEMKKVMG